MSENLYELLALAARYLFTGLMILIVARAWRITIIDSRRAKALRRMSPETGVCGEFLVLEGDERARRGMKYPVIREGQIGSGRKADVRIRHSSIRRRHAYFLMTENGLSVRAHAGAPLRQSGSRPVRQLLLQDGDEILIGRVRLLLVLAHTAEEGRRISFSRRSFSGVRHDGFDDPDFNDALFNPDPDQLFRDNPLLRHVPDPLNPPSEFDETDEYERWWPDGRE